MTALKTLEDTSRIHQQQQQQRCTSSSSSSSSSSFRTTTVGKATSICTTTTTTPTTTRLLLSNNNNNNQVEENASGGGSNNTNELMSLRRGSTVALVTPFHTETGNVDYDSLRNLIQYHINSGTDNLCILGTTGEANTLSMTERKQILQIVVSMVKGYIPIMVGCGTINPNDVHSMIQQAYDCGCDAALIVTPYYVKPPQRSLITHYTSIADTSPLPVIIYNVPGRTAVDMSDESIAIAALHENIVAVKDATGKLSRLQSLQEQLANHNINTNTIDSKQFLLYSGDDETSMEYVMMGGDGCISVTANIAAKSMHEIMMASYQQHDSTTAKQLNDLLVPLHTKLFCESNPMPVKYAASKLQLITSPYCRPPLTTLDTISCTKIVDDALRYAKLLQ